MSPEIHDPYGEHTRHEQELLHARELERIELAHVRRLQVLKFIAAEWRRFALAVGAGGVLLSGALLFPTCHERMRESAQQEREHDLQLYEIEKAKDEKQQAMIDTCIREGTNALSCRCAFIGDHNSCEE